MVEGAAAWPEEPESPRVQDHHCGIGVSLSSCARAACSMPARAVPAGQGKVPLCSRHTCSTQKCERGRQRRAGVASVGKGGGLVGWQLMQAPRRFARGR